MGRESEVNHQRVIEHHIASALGDGSRIVYALFKRPLHNAGEVGKEIVRREVTKVIPPVIRRVFLR